MHNIYPHLINIFIHTFSSIRAVYVPSTIITYQYFRMFCACVKRRHSFAHARYKSFPDDHEMIERLLVCINFTMSHNYQSFLLAGATTMTVVACGLLHPFFPCESSPDPSPAGLDLTINFSVAPDVG